MFQRTESEKTEACAIFVSWGCRIPPNSECDDFVADRERTSMRCFEMGCFSTTLLNWNIERYQAQRATRAYNLRWCLKTEWSNGESGGGDGTSASCGAVLTVSVGYVSLVIGELLFPIMYGYILKLNHGRKILGCFCSNCNVVQRFSTDAISLDFAGAYHRIFKSLSPL